MRTRLGHRPLAAALCAAVVAALGLVACGADEGEKDVVEGQPVELGSLRFNVQLTRFLNPGDREDEQYLRDQELPPPPGRSYLAVFLEVENESDDAIELPGASDFDIVDTTGEHYFPLESDSVFAFPLGEEVAGNGEIPEADSAAASGPVQGSFLLFLVSDEVSENRPLVLEIDADGEQGTVVLDI